MKIYISGPIKDKPDFESCFARAEHVLSIRDKYEVVNPCTIHDEELSYEEYMRADLKALLDCDEIYMLNGWEKSVGARAEHLVATMCGMKIRYQR